MSNFARSVKRRRITATVEMMLDQVAAGLEELRRQFPDDDYSARLYACDFCGALDGAMAPRAELIDFYPCPSCGMPSRGLTEALA